MVAVPTFLEFVQLAEASAAELVDGSNRDGRPFEPRRVEYVGMSFRRKILRFKVGKYDVEVRLPDLRVISKMKGSDVEKIKTALSGDIKVDCGCPDFRYGGFRFIGTQLGYSVKPEDRPPLVRNPEQAGTVCKHVTRLLGQMDDYVDDIAADFERSRKTKWYSSISRDVD